MYVVATIPQVMYSCWWDSEPSWLKGWKTVKLVHQHSKRRILLVGPVNRPGQYIHVEWLSEEAQWCTLLALVAASLLNGSWLTASWLLYFNSIILSITVAPSIRIIRTQWLNVLKQSRPQRRIFGRKVTLFLIETIVLLWTAVTPDMTYRREPDPDRRLAGAGADMRARQLNTASGSLSTLSLRQLTSET